ncbi:MAG TPA: pantoate--beta-alanine ligase [Paludibaculum sp.]|jgi:pantoate--beta-alanine ligase
MRAEVIATIAEMCGRLITEPRQTRTVGCVPTMGALHAGHGALIERARAESDLVVVTIFVNPIQFDRKDDYNLYVRQLDADRAFCEARGTDVIFAPSAQEMYPETSETFVEVPLVARHLCGAFRPGHFRGVATVVAKLFNIIQPDTAYFGEKDAQQVAVIQQMVRDLNFPTRIVAVPTVRESDGLALSSRNQRLTEKQRRAAPTLYRALAEGRRIIAGGERDSARVKAAATSVLRAEPGLELEYLEIVDPLMQPVAEISGDVRLVAAAWCGSTRLIDNLPCPAGVPEPD